MCGRGVGLAVEMRNRVAWVVVGLCSLVVAGCGSVSAVLIPVVPRPDSLPSAAVARGPRSCPRSVRGDGMIALAARRGVELVDLATCQSRVLADANATEVRFSADGRWVAFSPTGRLGPVVVSVRGGGTRSPLG